MDAFFYPDVLPSSAGRATADKSSTLKYMVENDHVIYAHCQARGLDCLHSAVLDMSRLVQRLGWDFDTFTHRDHLCWRLVCSKCNARRPDLIFQPYKRSYNAFSSYGVAEQVPMAEHIAKQRLKREREAVADKGRDVWVNRGKGRRRRFGGWGR